MTLFWNIIFALGGTATITAIAAFLAKSLLQHWLAKDIEDHKTRLSRNIDQYRHELAKELELERARLARANAQALNETEFQSEKTLIVQRGQVDLLRDQIKYLSESEGERRARLQAQIQRWTNPVRIAIGDLEHRIFNILDHGGYAVLSTNSPQSAKWSADYSYFMGSTLYYFAQYFSWTRLLQQELPYELFPSNDEAKVFWHSIERVSNEMSCYPYYKFNLGMDNSSVDQQVFRLQQHAIGELLIRKVDAAGQVLTYCEFMDRWLDPEDTKFKRHIAPLENFLTDLHPQNDLRWRRLEGTRKRLIELRDTCNRVLNSSGIEPSN